MALTKKHIPKNYIGLQSDSEYSITFNTQKEARYVYERGIKRLLDINNWHKLTRLSHFKLYDDYPQKGSYIEVNGNWVQIIRIHNSKNKFSITVRPAYDKYIDKTLHMFTDKAVKIFMIEIKGKKVTASNRGRNEVTNIKQTSKRKIIPNIIESHNIRYTGIQKYIWDTFTRKLLAF